MKHSKLIALLMVCVMVCVTVQPARAVEDKDGDGDIDPFDLALEILAECADDIAPYVEEYIAKPVKNWWNGEPEPKPADASVAIPVIMVVAVIAYGVYIREKKP